MTQEREKSQFLCFLYEHGDWHGLYALCYEIDAAFYFFR